MSKLASYEKIYAFQQLSQKDTKQNLFSKEKNFLLTNFKLLKSIKNNGFSKEYFKKHFS